MTDRKQLASLFKQHYREMYRLASIMLHDDAESKDIVHDVFAYILESGKDLKADTAVAYLMTSVRNRCLNRIRNMEIQERVEKLYLLDQVGGGDKGIGKRIGKDSAAQMSGNPVDALPCQAHFQRDCPNDGHKRDCRL